MRKIILFLISSACAIVAHATCSDSAKATICEVNSLPTDISSEMPADKYADVGLTRAEVERFLSNVQRDATKSNGLMSYVKPLYQAHGKPVYGNLNCENSKNGKLEHLALTPKFVQKHYNYLFSKSVKAVIAKQTESEIFVRNNSLMFGNGELWFYVENESNIVLNAINVSLSCPK